MSSRDPSDDDKRLSSGPRAVCHADSDCPANFICQNRRCRRIRKHVNLMYLFYLSGDRRFLSILGIYMHKLGKQGFRTVFPFYWHFWSESRTARAVFPLYYRFTYQGGRKRHTFVGPFHHFKKPEGSGFNFWPLLFYSNYGRHGSQFTLVPFGHYRRYRAEKSYGFLLPIGFFYGSKSPRHRTWAVIPWAFGRHKRDRATVWAFPLNFYRRNETGGRTYLFLPFVYAYRYRRDHTTVAFPLLWIWGSAESRKVVLFPLAWHFASRSRSTTVVLSAYHARRGSWWSAGVMPLFMFGRDRRTGSSHGALFPLFYFTRSRRHKRFVFASCLLSFRKQVGLKTWVWSIPPMYFSWAGQRRTAVVFPFYFGFRSRRSSRQFIFPMTYLYRNYETGERHTVVGPVQVRTKDGDRTVKIWPYLFLYERSKSSRTVGIMTPAGYMHTVRRRRFSSFSFIPWMFTARRPGSRTVWAFPFNFYMRRGDTRWYIFPPLLFGRRTSQSYTFVSPFFWAKRDQHQRQLVVLPLFWDIKSKDRRTTVFFPLYLRHRGSNGQVLTVTGPTFWTKDSKGHLNAGIAPILFFRMTGPKRHLVLFPLAFYFADRKDNARTLVVPPVYAHWGRRGWLAGVPPILYMGRRDSVTHGVVFPFLFYHHNRKTESRTLAAGPFYWFHRKSSSGFGVVPLFYRHRGPDYSGFSFIPLVHHWTSKQSRTQATFVLPFYARLRRRGRVDQVMLPFTFFGQGPTSRYRVFFPFFWDISSENNRNRTVVAGPLFYYRRKAARAGGVIPLFWARREGRKTEVATLPFVYVNRSPKKLSVWTPVFGFRKTLQSHDGFVGPYVWSSTPAHRKDFFVPFFFRSHNRKERATTTVAPFFYIERSPRGVFATLFPLFFHSQSRHSSSTMVLPLVGYFRSSKGRKQTLLAGPFLYYRRFQRQGLGLVPLTWVEWDKKGLRGFDLLPLIYVRKNRLRLAVFTPLGGFSSNRSQGKHFGFVGPYVWRSDRRRRDDLLFPFLMRFHKRSSSGTTLIIPPLLYAGHVSRERQFHSVFPFFWFDHSKRGSTSVVFPIFWDIKRRFGHRTTVAFPFFYRRRNYSSRSTSYGFLPGVWVKRSPENLSVVAFPLFWHFSSKRARTRQTAFFPFYWDFKAGQRRATVVFPLFWRFESANTRTYVVGNTFYQRERKGRRFRLLVLPFVDVARKRKHDIKWSILGGVFGYERIGHNRYMKILFIPFRISSKKARRSITPPSPSTNASWNPPPSFTFRKTPRSFWPI